MLRKTLLATSALVVASSMALAAGQHGKLTVKQIERAKQVQHHTLAQKMPGVIFDRKAGTPMAIRKQMTAGDKGKGVAAKFIPGGVNNFSKSKNALFLSYFGWFAGSANNTYSGSYSFCISYTPSFINCNNYENVKYHSTVNIQQSAAQPFTGVKSASAISVGAEQYSGTGGGKVAIYSDNAGAPGTAVAGAHGTFTSPPAFTGLCCSGLQTVTFSPVTLKKKNPYWLVMSGGKSNGRVVWNGQDSDFTAFPTGEDYNSTEVVHFKDTYKTSRSGHSSTYSSGFTSSTGGWIHTSSFSAGEQQAAFSVN